jgi:hypothetical protein
MHSGLMTRWSPRASRTPQRPDLTVTGILPLLTRECVTTHCLLTVGSAVTGAPATAGKRVRHDALFAHRREADLRCILTS